MARERRDQPRRLLAFAVVGSAVIAAVLLGTVAPHLHLGPDPAFSNQEHDLTLFVAGGSHGPLPGGLPVIALGSMVVFAVVLLLSRPASEPGRLSDPRAPPLA